MKSLLCEGVHNATSGEHIDVVVQPAINSWSKVASPALSRVFYVKCYIIGRHSYAMLHQVSPETLLIRLSSACL